MPQHDVASCVPSPPPSDFRRPPHNRSAVTDLASDAGDKPASTTVSICNRRVTTMSNNSKDGDYATRIAAESGKDCCDNRSDSGRGGSSVLRFERVANDDSEYRRDDDEIHRPHHVDVSCPSFNLDRPSSSPSVSFDADFTRFASESDIFDRSTASSSSASSLYDVYVQSPGCRRRQRQQRRRLKQLDEDFGHPSPSPSHEVVDGRKSGAQSSRRASRHRRGTPARGHRVSSSFENLVGGLLAAPRTRHRRHLSNAAETPAVSNTVLSASGSGGSTDSLCGRGADLRPVLMAFMSTGTPATAASDRLSSLPANPAAEPVLALAVKHAPQHVRRAKHLFKSCRSCVRHRSDNRANV